MSRYAAEFTAPREVGAILAVRAAMSDAVTVESRPAVDGRSRITMRFEAPDNYLARTFALAVQGDAPVDARIRRDSAMFPGQWYDLNEDG